jgi:hypothetical protein
MANRYTQQYRDRIKDQQRNDRRLADLRRASKRAEEDDQRRELLGKLEPLVSKALARFDESGWEGAREINRSGGPYLGKIRFIPAMYVTALGEYVEGGVPATTYLATNGQFYVWDNWYRYARLNLSQCPPWNIKLLIKELRYLVK